VRRGEQQTQFNYGVTIASGSGIDSNDVLASVYHPGREKGRESFLLDGESNICVPRQGRHVIMGPSKRASAL
jgi:hypothetical protein